MSHTFTGFALVATIAAIVGVFVGIALYLTLVAALIFLLVASAIALVVRRVFNPKERGGLRSPKMTPVQQRSIKTIISAEHATPRPTRISGNAESKKR